MSKYFMLNKPRGYLSACKDDKCQTVLSLFSREDSAGLFHVGRLDKDTEGLLIMTDDGAFCHRLMKPGFNVKKTYLFYAEGTLGEEKIGLIENGLCIYPTKSDRLTLPAKVKVIGTSVLNEYEDFLPIFDRKKMSRRRLIPVVIGELTITEGKKHQVRRMLKAVGCNVFYLKRLSIGELKLDPTLKIGEYRPLTDEELALLLQ